MGRTVCAYCKQHGEMTREHLWPASLHRRLMETTDQKRSAFWLARLQKEIPSEPQIRDVCAHCNNVVLSELDGYVCGLFDRALSRIPAFDEPVRLEYDYHLLKRWLLKMSFNSARIQGAADIFALEAMLPYIRGEDSALGRYTHLYLQMSYPEEVPEEDLVDAAELPRPVVFEPVHHRCGHFFFRVPGVGQKVLRAVHLRAYSFYLAFFQPGERTAVMADFEQVFTRVMRGTVRLRVGQTAVEVRCNGLGAWQSYRGSRVDRIVFGNGQDG